MYRAHRTFLLDVLQVEWADAVASWCVAAREGAAAAGRILAQGDLSAQVKAGLGNALGRALEEGDAAVGELQALVGKDQALLAEEGMGGHGHVAEVYLPALQVSIRS